jgi:hypothetical protein
MERMQLLERDVGQNVADHAAHKRFSQAVKTPVYFSQHWANSSVRHPFGGSRIKLALRQTRLVIGALLCG